MAPSRTERLGRRLAQRPAVAALLASTVAIVVFFLIWSSRPATTSSVGTVGPSTAEVGAPVLATGTVAPTFDLTSVRPGGGRVGLAAVRGRPVVVNFYASWCVPCRTELPLLERTARSVGSRVAFIGVDVNDVRTDAIRVAARDHLGYELGDDSGGAVSVRYRLLNLPDTVFVDATGHVRASRVGPLTAGTLAAGIAAAERG